MRDLEEEKQIKAYMAAKMTHIKMYNECMNLADGLDVEKFAELVRADEREARAKEWVGLADEEIKEIIGPWGDTPVKGYTRKLFDQIEAKLKEKNT